MSDEKSSSHSPVEEEAIRSEDGVDLTLIRRMLSLSPAQRLDVLQEHVRTVLMMQRTAEEKAKKEVLPGTELRANIAV